MLRATAFATSCTDLAPHPIEPSWIKKGAPVARSVTLTTSPDQDLTAGLWDCTAGTFTWIFYCDEIVQILEGAVNVHDGDRTLALRPGSVAYFPRGLQTVWEVPEYVKKAFVLREPPVSRLRKTVWRTTARLKALAQLFRRGRRSPT